MNDISSAIINLAEKHNFDNWRIVGNELQVKGVCPICLGGNSKDTGTFSINVNTGAWNCKRGNCPGIDNKGTREGNFNQLCNYFGEAVPTGYSLPRVSEQKKKSYKKPDPEIIYPMTDDIVTYFAKRKISEQTLLDWKVGADKNGNILFPFYRNDEFVYGKYRIPGKRKEGSKLPKEWAVDNAEPILYGMDMTTFNMPLVITEGLIDALSVYEAGYSNVVSVPSGCNNLEWINLCWDWLDNFNQFILFGDADEPGQEMVSIVSKRLGEDKCMIPKEYPECIFKGNDLNRICKDANEILQCYGPDYLKKMITDCEPAPIKGVLELSKIPFIDPTTVPKIITHISALNNMIGGLSEGGLTIISGKRGEGRLCSHKTW